MIHRNLEYSLFTDAKSFDLLRVKLDDPKKVYYHMIAPTTALASLESLTAQP